jgi:hypothetical protein
MTEAEWLTCTDVRAMLDYLGKRASRRKLRLLAVACCREKWSPLYADRCRTLLKLAEDYADGLARAADLTAARSIAYPMGLIWAIAPEAVEALSRCVGDGGPPTKREAKTVRSRIDEVLGNPFRPVEVDPAWLTSNAGCVLKVAEGIYEERRWHDLPILADALEEAGCDNAALLSHCREPGEHVRGCWAVDLLLGKD